MYSPADAPDGMCPRCLLRETTSDLKEPDANTESADAIGQTIGPYCLLKLLGEGGFAYVYLAEQVSPVHRQVALKLLKPGMDSKQIVARFETERQALALMEHPNVARVFDGGQFGGRPYFVMELVGSTTVTEYCHQARLGLEARLRLFQQICDGVGHAHRKGIIHRDLKPSNVLIQMQDRKPVPKVIDFGVAKALGQTLTDHTLFTCANQLIGTPVYMSPEQAHLKNVEVDTRSDVYSLGVLLYELLTGTTPFSHEDLGKLPLDEALRRIREVDPPKPSTRIEQLQAGGTNEAREPLPALWQSRLRGDLDRVVMKAIEKDPARRYETPGELARDIDRYLNGEPVHAVPPTPTYLLRRYVRRHRVGVSMSVGLAATLLVATVVSLLLAIRADQAEQAARESEASGRARFSRSDFQMARELLEEGEPAVAIAHLARATRTDENNRAAGFKLASLFAWENFALPLLPPMQHDRKLIGAAFSLDGSKIVSAAEEPVARIWDAKTGDQVAALRHQPRSAVLCLAVSPNGRHVATGANDTTARIWDIDSGDAVLKPFRHDSGVNDVAFSPTGDRLATASYDRFARIWNVEDGQLLTSVRHEAPVNAVVFDSEGSRLITGSEDRTARVWDAKTGEPLTPPLMHEGVVYRVAVSPDGTRVVTAAFDGTARIWDIETGTLLTHPLRHQGEVLALAVSRTGSVVTGSKGAAHVWDVLTGQPRALPLKHRELVRDLALSSDGQRLATASLPGRIWSVDTGKILTPEIPHPRGSLSVTFSPDGNQLVTGSRDNTARLWDVRPRRMRPLELNVGSPVWHVAFGADSERVLGMGFDGRTRIWNSATGEVLSSGEAFGREIVEVLSQAADPNLRSGVRTGKAFYTAFYRDWSHNYILPQAHRFGRTLAIAISSDGKFQASGSSEGEVRIWNLETGQPIGPIIQTAAATLSLAFSPNSEWLASGSTTGRVQVWRTSDGTEIAHVNAHSSAIPVLAFAPDGQRIVTGAWDGAGAVWKVGEPQSAPLRGQHDRAILQLAFDPAGDHVATGSWDNSARVWDMNTGQPVGPSLAHIDHTSGWGILVSFTRDGSRLVTTGSHDGTARVWNPQTGQEVTPPLQHPAGVLALAHSPDGSMIATACDNATAQVWDLETGEALTPPFPHQGKVFAVAFSLDGNRLATGSQDGFVRIWDLPRFNQPLPEWFLELAEAHAGARLDESGILQRTSHADLRRARETVEQLPSSDPLTAWAKWLAADPDHRTISPYSKLASGADDPRGSF